MQRECCLLWNPEFKRINNKPRTKATGQKPFPKLPSGLSNIEGFHLSGKLPSMILCPSNPTRRRPGWLEIFQISIMEHEDRKKFKWL